ncbi:ABC transporter ATP-binding protein [Clostridium faecium]|uniref:ABC transporter ATP-binding protein n=1 Tax=Clostridium faecium TaxID=2762223 RepID=A0ABR8YTF0_9CLOT|nr:ABC transporter ATP-binding protein [Clostridium faecium]MBD8047556.1 ABC transporter ATP-binding protein [Clostridium faecium]
MFLYENVSIQYDGNIALSNFSLMMGNKEIVALVGESGSGKTSVIRGAMGLLSGKGEIVDGDILFEGKSLLNRTSKQWQEIRGKKISMIFQDSGAMLNPIRTIGSQFIEYICTHEDMNKKDAWEKGRLMLEKMGLSNSERIMKSYTFQLSGGMRQRVGIAMAMTFNPKLLLADEPTSALDVTTQAQIVKEMMDLRDHYDTSILIVTHNLGVAAYMADRILVMKDGKIIEEGKTEDVIRHPKDIYTRNLIDAVPDMREARYV